MCGAGTGRGAGSAEHYSVVEKQGAVVRRSPGSIYENFLKASRSKAVSRRRCSSVRWVFLLPVAGAAAGSRPAYLRGATVRGDGEGPRGARAPLPSPGPSRLPATLPHRLGAVDGGPQPGLHVVVVALVLVLLLAPGQLGAGVYFCTSCSRRSKGKGESWGEREELLSGEGAQSTGRGWCPRGAGVPGEELSDP